MVEALNIPAGCDAESDAIVSECAVLRAALCPGLGPGERSLQSETSLKGHLQPVEESSSLSSSTIKTKNGHRESNPAKAKPFYDNPVEVSRDSNGIPIRQDKPQVNPNLALVHFLTKVLPGSQAPRYLRRIRELEFSWGPSLRMSNPPLPNRSLFTSMLPQSRNTLTAEMLTPLRKESSQSHKSSRS
jgi:hypothetical protein